ncbi:MAG: hypothetical protein ISS26_04680 [Candidatus Omnitrophica bacterium]|nr:hypothetical protein [Candidatus Omnitrophota bacterium]
MGSNPTLSATFLRQSKKVADAGEGVAERQAEQPDPAPPFFFKGIG